MRRSAWPGPLVRWPRIIHARRSGSRRLGLPSGRTPGPAHQESPRRPRPILSWTGSSSSHGAARPGAAATPGRADPGLRARGPPPAEVPAWPRTHPRAASSPDLSRAPSSPASRHWTGPSRSGGSGPAPAQAPRPPGVRPACGGGRRRRLRHPPGPGPASGRERTPREPRRARKRVSNRALIAVAAVAVMGGAAFVLLTGHTTRCRTS